MYMVISKPYRISVYSDFVHMVIVLRFVDRTSIIHGPRLTGQVQ